MTKPSKEREVLYKDVVGRKIKITCNSFAPDWIHQKGKKAEIIDYTGEDMYLIRVINSEKEPHKFYLSKKDFEFIVPNPKTSMESRFENWYAKGDLAKTPAEMLAYVKAELEANNKANDKKWVKRIEGMKKKEGKHDGHNNDDRCWCYDCQEAGEEEDFTQNWKYNQALSDLLQEGEE